MWIFSKDKLKNDNGSTLILVMIILSTVITVTVMMITLGKVKAEQGTQKSLLSLAARSVLSEYCEPLKDEYGIFGLSKTPGEISDEFAFYIDENIEEDLSSINIITERYKMTNSEIFEKEIVEFSKFAFVDNILDNLKNDYEANDEENIKEDNSREDIRVLRNSKIINSLPSKNAGGGGVNTGDIVDAMKDIDALFDKGKKTVLVNMYAVNMFNNHVNDNGETFFKNEVEYIIAGKYDDKANYQNVRNKIIIARNIINLAVIYNTPELKAEVVTLAAMTTVGMEVAVPLIAEAWALMEANNDVKILEHGGKIPIVKTKDTWAVDIRSSVESNEDEYIDNNSETGMDYEDYLHVMLYFVNKDTKYKRMMDLMQINIQGKYDEEFFMDMVVAGFGYEIQIGENEYKKDEIY